MLCPEVWDFLAPTSTLEHKFCENNSDVFEAIRNQYFNHSVTVILPDTLQPPTSIKKALLEDSQYYRVNRVPLDEILKEDFIDLFVTKGQLTAISIGEVSEQDDFLALLPTKKLILSLSNKSHQELGIESTPVKSCKSGLGKQIIVSDLTKQNNLIKKCNRTQKFSLLSKLYFDIILVWEPNDSNICPSSIAFYFSRKGYSIKTCDIQSRQRQAYNVKVPCFDEECDISELMEWIGAFSLDCHESSDTYISTYKYPEKHQVFGQIVFLNFTGLITVNRIQQVASAIQEFSMTKSPSTWISLIIQGFQDGVIKIGKGQFLPCNLDHHLTVIFPANKPPLVCNFEEF